MWGREIWLTNTELYCLKRLVINPGWQCSLHRHLVKDETFILDDGAVFLAVGAESLVISRRGATVRIPAGVFHRFGTVAGASLLEVSTHHDDADVERLVESRPLYMEDWSNAVCAGTGA